MLLVEADVEAEMGFELQQLRSARMRPGDVKSRGGVTDETTEPDEHRSEKAAQAEVT